MTADPAATVVEAGWAEISDLGRPGLGRYGVAVGGAADGFSARTANLLVGNPAGAPLIEVTGSSFAVRTAAPLLLAVTGATGTLVVDGVAHDTWEPLVVGAGSHVALPAPRVGFRSYLAINGVLQAPAVLGSVAADPVLGVGTRLAPGAAIVVRSEFRGLDHPHFRLPLLRLRPRRPSFGDVLTVEVTPGPHAHEFDRPVHLSADGRPARYRVDPASDRIGLRLRGEHPTRRRTGGEILSRPVPVGAVEIPPRGGVIVLLRGRYLTAGYPVVAVATRCAVDRLGQARPDATLLLRPVDLEQAVAAARQQEAELATLARRVAVVFDQLGVPRGIQGGR